MSILMDKKRRFTRQTDRANSILLLFILSFGLLFYAYSRYAEQRAIDKLGFIRHLDVKDISSVSVYYGTIPSAQRLRVFNLPNDKEAIQQLMRVLNRVVDGHGTRDYVDGPPLGFTLSLIDGSSVELLIPQRENCQPPITLRIIDNSSSIIRPEILLWSYTDLYDWLEDYDLYEYLLCDER